MKLTTLYEKYNGSIIDDGGQTSLAFCRFSSDFRKTLDEICSEIGAEWYNYCPFDYSLYAFIRKNGKCCYISYRIPLKGVPLDMNASDRIFGWLYRPASSLDDFMGGLERYCNTLSLQTCISKCLDEQIN